MPTGHVTKTAIFASTRWRTAVILKIHISVANHPISIIFAIRCDLKESNFYKFKLAVVRDIKNFFILYFGAILADLCEICKADVESHANTDHDQNSNFS